MRAFNIYKKGSGDLLGTILENGRIDIEGKIPLNLLASQIKRNKNDGKGIVIVKYEKTKKGNISGSESLKLSVKELAYILNNYSHNKINKRKPLSQYDREIILDLSDKGFSYSAISNKVNRSKSTISRVLN